MGEVLKKLRRIPKQKMLKIIVITGIIAVVGIFLSDMFSGGTKSDKSVQNTTSINRAEYERETEKRLSEILKEIDGVGSCSVMVTLDSSEENVYSRDEDSSSESGEDSSSSSNSKKHIIVDNAGEGPVLEMEIQPKIRGVIVVCEGAENINVKQAVIDAVTAGLGVSSANISVVKGGNTNG